VRRSIQTFVSNLRSLCCDTIERRGDGYVLSVDRNAVDALRFEDAVALARFDENPEHAAESLREALGLWRGYPYADIDAHGLLEPDIARLTELRISALGSRIDADLEAGRHATIASELASLSGEYPLREHFRAQHMIALYRSGRQAEALRVCNVTRSYLAEEIGIELSEELRDLEQRILEQDPSLAYQSSTEIRRIAVLAADASSLARLDPEHRKNVVELQESVINDAAGVRSGRIFAHRGSAIYASFPTVQLAVDAAAIVQQDLAAPDMADALVAMAIDIGDVEARDDGDIAGPPVTRTSALVGAAHGARC
jgi:DNA-binding SARP family transcriptional activator